MQAVDVRRSSHGRRRQPPNRQHQRVIRPPGVGGQHPLGLLLRRDPRHQRGAEVGGDAVGGHDHAVAGASVVRTSFTPGSDQPRTPPNRVGESSGVAAVAVGAHQAALDVADPGPASAGASRGRTRRAWPRRRASSAAPRGSARSSVSGASPACAVSTARRRPRPRRPRRRRGRGRRWRRPARRRS